MVYTITDLNFLLFRVDYVFEQKKSVRRRDDYATFFVRMVIFIKAVCFNNDKKTFFLGDNLPIFHKKVNKSQICRVNNPSN